MNQRLKYALILLFIIITGLCVYRLFYRQSIPGRNLPAAVALSAAALTDSFDKGEDHADSLYLDRTLSVTGTLAGIRKNESGRFVVTLAGHYPGKTGVDCILDSLYAPDRLNIPIGKTVTVMGHYAGRSFNVLLVQCILLPK
jgi:putative nucleic acid binding protein